MSRLLADHNISRDVQLPLWSAGHDVLLTRDVGLSTVSDDALLLFCTQEVRIFVTHNRKDFKLLHDAWVTWPAAFGLALPPHPGILLLDPSPPETLSRILAAFLRETAPEVFANGIFWWHRRDGWRKPGVGTSWVPWRRSSEIARE